MSYIPLICKVLVFYERQCCHRLCCIVLALWTVTISNANGAKFLGLTAGLLTGISQKGITMVPFFLLHVPMK